MTAVGVTVQARTAAVPRGIPVLTDTVFLTTKMATGGDATAAHECRNLGDFVAAYGARATVNEATYDWLETFFNEGGKRAIVAQYVATHADALALLVSDLGPGQLVNIGETPGAVAYAALIADAKAKNRVAVLDVASTDNTAALLDAAADDLVGLADPSYAALFGPWVNVPPPSGIVGGTARTVPASAAVCGLIARADALGNPNRAAAGRDFPLQYATGFVCDLGGADRNSLLTAGLNPGATIFGVLENYGFQTSIAQGPDDPYWQFNAARCRMAIVARAEAVGERYVFKPIDGRGLLAMALEHDLSDMLAALYAVDALYGATADEAYAVSADAAINTTDTIAQGELHAIASVRYSMHAKSVVIELVTVPLGGAVSS
jgi:hypothetical protein